jgi:TolA-binding protein
MKFRSLAIVSTLFVLNACSLLERREENVPQEEASPKAVAAYENEISRLNTKIEALETKMEVLTNSLEKQQMRASQPRIQAETMPVTQVSEAADLSHVESREEPVIVREVAPSTASAVSKPRSMPSAKKSDTALNSATEKEFRAAMELFQTGRNLEAAAAFNNVARKYPAHALASHALYWSGESFARNQQWSSAADAWQSVEKNYPHSAYLPEALAGLARAYDAQGNSMQGQAYRTMIMKSFPNAPVALNLATHQTEVKEEMAPAAASHDTVSTNSVATEPGDFEAAEPSSDEQ